MDEQIIKSAWKKYFLRQKRQRFGTALSLFILFWLAIYLGLTPEAQIKKLRYFFEHIGKAKEKSEFILPKAQDESLFLPNVKSQTQSQNKYSFKNLENNHLFIPKIYVNTPIIWNSAVDEKTMLSNLQNGVVHYRGSALPDEMGNVFITGHSSYYAWDKGKYKTVFTLLPKLEKDDQIALAYNNQVYVYEVTEKIVVKPTDTWVLNPTDTPILSLMTCTPIGTNLKRLIVKAKPISQVQKQIQKPQQEPLKSLPDVLLPD